MYFISNPTKIHASPLLSSASASAAETSDGALKIAALLLHLHRRH
jgi:hypothetical protein